MTPRERTLIQPTIVLVHGAFAESASWDGVIEPLVAEGHPVVAAANPLRGLAYAATTRLILEVAAVHAAAA